MKPLREYIDSIKGAVEDLTQVQRTISKDVASIRITQTKQENILKEHVRRTDILEEKILPLAEDKLFKDKLWQWCGRIGAAVAAGAGTVVAISEALEYVNK